MNHQDQDSEGEAPGNSGGEEEIRAELGLGAPRGAPRGWYSRGYLPHYNNTGTIQSVTFRLADSLPQTKLREIEAELCKVAPAKIDAERRKKIEVWLDAGIGCCALRNPELAKLMQETLVYCRALRFVETAWEFPQNMTRSSITIQVFKNPETNFHSGT